MLISKTAELRWSHSYKKYYEDLGYIFTSYEDTFPCKIEDLFKGSDCLVEVSCDYCGKHYKKKYKKYILQRKTLNKDACKDCGGKKNMETRLVKYGTKSPTIFPNFIEGQNERFESVRNNLWEKVKCICRDSNYTLLSDKCDYNKDYIEYICNKHKEQGIQHITRNHLLRGEGCKCCGVENRASNQRFTYARVKEIVENDFSEDGCVLISSSYTNYNAYDLEIECCCGNHFITSLGWFIKGKRKCGICSGSNGEYEVDKFLKEHYIEHINQHRFPDCVYKNQLVFDFYIPSKNMAIEYDGQQHYFPVQFGGISLGEAIKEYHKNKIRDSVKNKYCKNNGINLIRIPYWEFANINNILCKKLIV